MAIASNKSIPKDSSTTSSGGSGKPIPVPPSDPKPIPVPPSDYVPPSNEPTSPPHTPQPYDYPTYEPPPKPTPKPQPPVPQNEPTQPAVNQPTDYVQPTPFGGTTIPKADTLEKLSYGTDTSRTEYGIKKDTSRQPASVVTPSISSTGVGILDFIQQAQEAGKDITRIGRDDSGDLAELRRQLEEIGILSKEEIDEIITQLEENDYLKDKTLAEIKEYFKDIFDVDDKSYKTVLDTLGGFVVYRKQKEEELQGRLSQEVQIRQLMPYAQFPNFATIGREHAEEITEGELTGEPVRFTPMVAAADNQYYYMLESETKIKELQEKADGYQKILDESYKYYDYKSDPATEDERNRLIAEGWEAYYIETASGKQLRYRKPQVILLETQAALDAINKQIEAQRQKYDAAKKQYDYYQSLVTLEGAPTTITEPVTVESLPVVGDVITVEEGQTGTVVSVDEDPVTGLITVYVQAYDDPALGGWYYYYSKLEDKIVRTDEEGNILTTTTTLEPEIVEPSGVFKVSDGVYEYRDSQGNVISTAYITDKTVTITGLGQTQIYNVEEEPLFYYNQVLYFLSGGEINPNNLSQGGYWIEDTYYNANGEPIYTKEQGVIDPNIKVREDIKEGISTTPDTGEVEIPDNAIPYYTYAPDGTVQSTAYITDDMVIIIGGASKDIGRPVVYKLSKDPAFYHQWKEYFENGGVFTPSQGEIANMTEEDKSELIEKYPALEDKLELTDPYWIARQEAREAQSNLDKLVALYDTMQGAIGEGGVVRISEGVYEYREPNGTVISTAYITGDTITIEGIDLVGTQVFNINEEPQHYHNLLIYYLSGGVINPNNTNQGGRWKGDTFYTYDGTPYYKIGEGIINEIPEVTQDDIDNAKEQLDRAKEKIKTIEQPKEEASLQEQLSLLYNRFQQYGGLKEAIKGGMTDEQLKALGFTEAQLEVSKYEDVENALQAGVSETTLALAGLPTTALGTRKYIEDIKTAFKDYEIDVWQPEGGFQTSYDIVGLVEGVDAGTVNEEYLKYLFGEEIILKTRESIAQGKADQIIIDPYAIAEWEYRGDPGYEEARDELIADGWEEFTSYVYGYDKPTKMWRKRTVTGYNIDKAIEDGVDRETLIRLFGEDTVIQTEIRNALLEGQDRNALIDKYGEDNITAVETAFYDTTGINIAEYLGGIDQYKTDIAIIGQYATGAKGANYYDYKSDPGYKEARDELTADGWEPYTIETAGGTQTMWRKAKPELKDLVSSGQVQDVSYDTIQIVRDVISGKIDSDTVDRLFGEDFLDTYQPAVEAIGTATSPIEAKQSGVADNYIDLLWGTGAAQSAQEMLDKITSEITVLEVAGVITTDENGNTVIDIEQAANNNVDYSTLVTLTGGSLDMTEQEYNQYKSQLSALDTLTDYISTDEDGNTLYDVNKFITENPTLEAIQILTNAGFSADVITDATNYVNNAQEVLARLNDTLTGTQGYSDKLILTMKAEELGLIEKAYQEKGKESGLHPSYYGTQLVQGGLVLDNTPLARNGVVGIEVGGSYHIYDYEDFVNSLSEEDKIKLAGAMGADPNISNAFASTVAKLNYEWAKMPEAVQIGVVFIPYFGMPFVAGQMVSTTIAKATTGQKITALEIAVDAAVTALAILTHVKVNTPPAKFIAKTIEVGAVSTFALQFKVNYNEMSVKDRYINGAMMLIPAIGWSAGLGRVIKNKILEGSPEAPIKVAERQKAILDKLVTVNKDIINEITIRDPEVRKQAEIKADEMQKNVSEYADTAFELAQTRKSIADMGLAKSKGELEVLEKLQAKEKELNIKLQTLEKPLKQSIKEYNDVISNAIKYDEPLILQDERIKNLPDTMKRELDAIANEIVNPRNAVDVYKDTQSLNRQIEELESRIKRIDSLSIEEIKGIESLIQELKSQIISLNKEARLLELAGETVKVEGKNVKVEIKSLQSKLVDANKKLSEYQTPILEGVKVTESGFVVEKSKLGEMGTTIESPNVAVNREVRDLIDTVADIYGLKTPENVKEVKRLSKGDGVVGTTSISGDYVKIVKRLKTGDFESQLETIVHELVHSNYTTIDKNGIRKLDNILGKELFSDAEEYVKTQLRKEGWKTEEYINNEMEAYKGAIERYITEIFTIYKTEALTGAKNEWYLDRNIQLLSDMLSSENKAKAIASNIKDRVFADTKNKVPISNAEQYFTDYQKAELNTAITETRFRGKYAESRESPLSYEVHRKGELIAEAEVARAERDIFEAVENIYDPIFGKESYTKELNILNEKLDSLISTMKEFGISEKVAVDSGFKIYDAIIKKDSKILKDAIEQLQLEAGKIPDKALQLKAGEEIKLLAVRAEDLMSSYKFTSQKPPKSEYETVYEPETIDTSITREAERIYQSRYEKLARTIPEGRKTPEDIMDYLREKYDKEYFESTYEGKYKDIDDFLDMNRIEQEIRNQKRIYEEEILDIKRDIDIHEKEIELTDIFKKKETLNKETRDIVDERSKELQRQVEEKKRKLQLAEKEKLVTPLEKTRGLEEPVRVEESLVTSEKALMPKDKAVEKLVEEIESEARARKAVEETKTEIARRAKEGESLFGIKPKPKISSYASPETKPEHIGAMTPEQKQRLYGMEEEQFIDARSPYIKSIPDIDAYIKTVPTIIPEPKPISIPAPAPAPVTIPVPMPITEPITTPVVSPMQQPLPLPETKVQELPKEDVKAEPVTKIIEVPKEEIKQEIKPPKKTGIIPPLDWDEEDVEKWKKEGFPAGTITWKQGMFWKVIPPPYDKSKPISMFDPPIGAVNTDAVGEGASYKTLQVLGDKVPKDVRVDLGWTDVIIKTDPETNKPRIQYLQGGLETNVGSREQSNYKGMTIIGEPSSKDTTIKQYTSKDLRRSPYKKKALSLSEAIEEEPETKISYEPKYSKPKQNNVKRGSIIDDSYLDNYYLGRKLPDSGLEVQI